jgi:hypothetical protein
MDPTNKASMGSQWYDRKPLDMKMALEAIRVLRQERIHKTKQLHDALVLAEIFVTLQEVLIFLSVAAFEIEASGALFRYDD